jgi:hypothetical protein
VSIRGLPFSGLRPFALGRRGDLTPSRRLGYGYSPLGSHIYTLAQPPAIIPLKNHVLVPTHSNGIKIGRSETAEFRDKQRFFRSDDPVQHCDGWFQQSCGLPFMDHQIHSTASQPTRYTTDDGILAEVKEH